MAEVEATVHLRVDDRVATITLDHPPLNILDLTTMAALDRLCDELANQSDLQVIVLRGAGQKSFCAGVDIAIHTKELIPRMIGDFHRVLRKWWNLEPLTVAAVHGHCLGGGMELASVCDLVVAESGARFGQPEIKVGCYPPVAVALYPALLGPGRTLDLVSTGRILSAEKAEAWGFVTRLAPQGGLDLALETLVGELTSQSAVAQRLGKKAVRRSLGEGFERALDESERLYLEEMAATHDVEEGARAFLEKRNPVWQHR